MSLNEKRKFGKINNAPPSFFARVPSAAVTDKRLSDKEFRVLAALCAYANNQGFAWPNIDTLYDDLSRLKAPISRRTISRALDKLRRGTFIEVISRHRSHEKWRHVMGTVHRVIYDERLTVDDLHDAMTKETPPPVNEHALPKQAAAQDGEGKQQGAGREVELVEVTSLAQWYCKECHGLTGQLRLVNEAAFNATKQALADNSADAIKTTAIARLMECRHHRQTPPQHLGFMAKGSGA